AASIGAFLVALGRKVLLIDTDAATNSLTLLYLKEVLLQREKAITDRGVLRGLYEEPPFMGAENLSQLPIGADLLPATYNFINTEDQPFERYAEALRLALDAFQGS